MARREQLNDEQRRLLRIVGRMSLASVANLACILGANEDRVRAMLGRLRSGGWVSSVLRGMTERRQHRFFLTSLAVDLLYATDHRHPSPREEARASGLAAFHPEGELPPDFQERFALDHDHPAHLEHQAGSPLRCHRSYRIQRRRPGPRAPPVDRHLPWHRDLPQTPGHAGAGLPPGPQPAPKRPGQLARRRYGGLKRSQDDRLPPAQARRVLPRRGPLRRTGLDPLHLRRPPRHRAGAAAQGTAPPMGAWTATATRRAVT